MLAFFAPRLIVNCPKCGTENSFRGGAKEVQCVGCSAIIHIGKVKVRLEGDPAGIGAAATEIISRYRWRRVIMCSTVVVIVGTVVTTILRMPELLDTVPVLVVKVKAIAGF
jgi:hypothetical protein